MTHRRLVLAAALAVSPVLAIPPPAHARDGAAPAAPQSERCAAHGVKRTICTRCNPKLAPVFKAKGDWCAEHDRPESQCVLCNKRLAREGVK